MGRQIDSGAITASGRPVIRGQNTEALRAVPKRDRLAEVRCTAVPGRNGTAGWLVMVIRRGAGLDPVELGDDKFYVLTCKCGLYHAASRRRVAEAAAAAAQACSSVPVQLNVADLAA